MKFKSTYALLQYLVKNHRYYWAIHKGRALHSVRYPLCNYTHVIQKGNVIIYADAIRFSRAYITTRDRTAIPSHSTNTSTSYYALDINDAMSYQELFSIYYRCSVVKNLRVVSPFEGGLY